MHIGANLEAAQGLWAKTLFQKQGHILTATTYLVVRGEPEIIKVSVDLRPIERAVRRYHARRLHRPGGAPIVGFPPFDQIASAAKAIGRSKLVKKVAGAAKSVIRSKITGAVLTATAAAFPAVGAPALAAYAAANIALDQAEAGKKVAHAVGGLAKKAGLIKKAGKRVRGLKKAVRGGFLVKAAMRKKGLFSMVKGKVRINTKALRFLPSRVRKSIVAKLKKAASAKKRLSSLKRLSKTAVLAKHKRLANLRALARLSPKQRLALQASQKRKALLAISRMSPKQQAQLKALAALKASAAARKKLAAIARDPRKRAQLIKLSKLSRKQRASLRSIVEQTRSRDPKVRDKALRQAAILRIVAKNRAQLRATAGAARGGIPGLVIDNAGRITRGRFAKRLNRPGEVSELIYTGPGQTSQGQFTRIAGNRYDCIPLPVRVGCGGRPCAGC